MCLDRDWEDIGGESEDNFDNEVTGEELAYLIYTSGSTGAPKAVAMSHRPLCNLIAWQIKTFTWSIPAKTLQFASLSFDVSFQEIFTTWCSGGTLLLVSEEVRRDAAGLLQFLRDESVERLFLPYVALQQLAEGADNEGAVPTNLREVITAGEQLQITREIANLFSKLKDCTLQNQYGPSESHVVTTYSLTGSPSSWPALPAIGRPIANINIAILDRYLNPVSIGVPGELYIGGVGLAHGYLDRAELTAEKFIPHPFSEEPGARLYRTGDLARYLPDGNIQFLGRIDDQVKIRGFRIELREIEVILAQHPSVRESVAVAREDPGDRRLVAYVVAAQDAALSTNELRRFLKQKLPEYMIPSAFVFLDALPLTVNGKVDRRALPAPGQSRPELDENFSAPRTPIEERLAGIWSKLLGLSQVSIRDNFFDLGGHSLLAVRLFAEIEKVFNQRPPLSSLFQDGTIEHLAKIIDHKTPLGKQSCLVAIQPRGTKRPFFCVHTFFGDVLCYMNLARHLGPDQPFYAIEARGLNGAEEPFDNIKTMAAHHIEQIRAVQPHGPYALGGLCFAAVVAFEMAQQLREKGERVAMVALLDSHLRDRSDGKPTSRWNFLRDLILDLPAWLMGSLELNRSQWVDLVELKIRMTRARKAVSNGSDIDPQIRAGEVIREMGDFFHFSEQHYKIARSNSRALRDYKPQVYPGRLTLFKARMQPLFSSHKPDKGWKAVAAGGLEVRVVPGNQLAMLKEPHVQVLAEQLRTCLNRALTEVNAEENH